MENPMLKASAELSAQKIARTVEVLEEMVSTGTPVNFYSVAVSAGVSRQFLYRQEVIRKVIAACRVTGMTKKELQQEVVNLRLRVMELETKM